MSEHDGVVFLDLEADFNCVRDRVSAAMQAVISRQQFINGAEVEEFERVLAAMCDCEEAVAVSSGTDALLASLMALGVKPGDEVITSPFTFFATAGSIARLGAIPRFADIEPRSFNINPEAVESLVGSRTVGILPVHLFGQMADMTAIQSIASRHSLFVLEDAAQAIGAAQEGRPPGSVGTAACFSFFPSKNLGAMGDAGAIVTKDPGLARVLRRLREHGSTDRYHHLEVGGNFRMDTLQAAVLLAKSSMLERWTKKRQANALTYRELFVASGVAGESPIGDTASESEVVLPHTTRGNTHVFNQFVVRAARRDDLSRYLRERSVGHAIYYPVPLHLQSCFKYLGYEMGELPHAERAADQVLALPVYPGLSHTGQERVVASIRSFFDQSS